MPKTFILHSTKTIYDKMNILHVSAVGKNLLLMRSFVSENRNKIFNITFYLQNDKHSTADLTLINIFR